LNQVVLAIDIGSTKVCALIAEREGDKLQIIGHGIAKSQGIKKGVITNIELASKSIKKAVSDAKRISASNINTAIISISNAYAKSLNSNGIVNIPHKDISIKEIERVIHTAQYNANIPTEYDVIHILPYNFKVDDQDFIENPFGMNGSRMEVNVNIIMTQKSSLSNLKKAVRSAGIEIEGIVLNGYASAIATMSEDEKELGVAVIDLGGQTSNMIIHTGNSIRYNDFLSVGSNHITNDLSMALHTPLQIAENVKKSYGDLLGNSNEIIELPVIGDEENCNAVSLEIVHSVILARVEETLMILAKSLNKSLLKEQIGAGIILTGGMTKLKGIREMAQAIFGGMSVRIAQPEERYISGLFDDLKDPAYSTVIGLLLYIAGKHTEYEINFNNEMLYSKNKQSDEYETGNSDDTADEAAGGTKPNLVDIKLDKIIKDKKEAKEAKNAPASRGEESFPFGELPEVPSDNNNPIKKIANWAKQLF